MNRSEVRLFVGNLPEDITPQDLGQLFSTFGQITNLDLKIKVEDQNKKSFAFVTLAASNYEIETCIKHFSSKTFHGSVLYVTRARESFLERLQREREVEQNKALKNDQDPSATSPRHIHTLKLGDNLNPRKRKVSSNIVLGKDVRHLKTNKGTPSRDLPPGDPNKYVDPKKDDSDRKRIESLKKKREEFKQRQNLIRSGLRSVDKVQNKRVVFSDHDLENTGRESPEKSTVIFDSGKSDTKKTSLFDDEDSGDEINFNVKKQFEGKKGQKVLDLQSRYKSDKRFTLDERFIDDEKEGQSAHETEHTDVETEQIELGQADEKTRQMNILQDVLGVEVRTRKNTEPDSNKSSKAKIGMLRFDPLQPEHAKFLAPTEEKPSNKPKKKTSKEKLEVDKPPEKIHVPKVEVSKEQFYNISETLKETITQPTTFSLRSLFGNKEEDEDTLTSRKDNIEQDYLALPKEERRTHKKNPLEPGQRNPFVYDSSDSENDEEKEPKEPIALPSKPVESGGWVESLFFSTTDVRLRDGLDFFGKTEQSVAHKSRRELKSLMKKRIYNKERKNQMFQKKIGGRSSRRKTMKKSYRKS